ncbi:hypothetical protein IMSAG249_02393 [Lachnospiraceae bacterium]|nr:hypothetical protein IMSAG249_02393 [Lachnospiraceae bacterium]
MSQRILVRIPAVISPPYDFSFIHNHTADRYLSQHISLLGLLYGLLHIFFLFCHINTFYYPFVFYVLVDKPVKNPYTTRVLSKPCGFAFREAVMAALYKWRLTIGSYAMDVCEPCQVGNKAALNRIFHVP